MLSVQVGQVQVGSLTGGGVSGRARVRGTRVVRGVSGLKPAAVLVEEAREWDTGGRLVKMGERKAEGWGEGKASSDRAEESRLEMEGW